MKVEQLSATAYDDDPPFEDRTFNVLAENAGLAKNLPKLIVDYSQRGTIVVSATTDVLLADQADNEPHVRQGGGVFEVSEIRGESLKVVFGGMMLAIVAADELSVVREGAYQGQANV